MPLDRAEICRLARLLYHKLYIAVSEWVHTGISAHMNGYACHDRSSALPHVCEASMQFRLCLAEQA